MKGQGRPPWQLVTDKLRSYSAAHREVMPSVVHDTDQYRNNLAEVSHEPTRQRERQMRKFKAPGQAQRFLTVHGLVQNLFRVGRHLLQAHHHRELRDRAFIVWQEVTCARLVKKFVRHFDRVARPEYGLTRPCYTNYSGSTRLRVIADQYRNRPTILRLPKMNTASRRPDRPQNQNESSVPSRYRTRLSANAAKKSIELQ